MEIARKEKWLGVAGLGMALVGAAWFGLSAASNVLQGMVKIFGFPLGAGLVIGGLVMAGVYFWRWRRIRKLVGGENLLAQWNDGSAVYLAPDCAYVDGNLHLWSGMGARLDQVNLVEKQIYGSSATYLEIEYANSVQTRDVITGRWTRIWKQNKLSLRIPAEKLDDIRRVVEKLQERKAV